LHSKKKHTNSAEFGNKVGLIASFKNLIITARKDFRANPHESKSIEPCLNQMQTNLNYLPKEVVYDSGGKGQKEIGQTTILTPDYRLLIK